MVATCIGCGARSRGGDCPGGCDDAPIDLVEAADLVAFRERLAALERRGLAVRDVAAALLAGAPLDRLRAQARAALAHPVPSPPPAPEVVEAWGCLRCGRVDAPQPCLGICVRRPVAMVPAAELHALTAATAALEDDAALAVARMLAWVTPRPERERETRAAQRARITA